MADSDKLKCGNNSDFEIFHNGASNNTEVNHTNNSSHLQITSNRLKLMNYDGPTPYIDCISGGAVELYHAGGKKLETNSTGSTLFCTGNGNNEGPKIEGSSSMPAILNFQADAGAANADKCRFYGHQNGGSLLLQDFSAGSFQNMAKFNYGGNVELYNNNVKKWETTNDGSTQYGNLTIPDNDAKIILKDGNNYIQFLNTDKEFKFMNAWGAGEFTFYPGGTERVRINPNGLLFNGDTASANALDDYETGTCSNIGITSAASSHVQKDSGTVYYTKIGRVVHLYGSFNASNLSTHFGGTHIQIAGFPFSTNSYGNSSDILVGIWGGSFNWWNAGYPSISMENSTTTHGLYSHRTPSGTGLGNYSGPDGNTCGNGTHQFNFDLIYFTDA